MSRSQWFEVEADLWREPGDNKLDWPTRKLAIHLREAAGVLDADDDEVGPNVVLRSIRRLATETRLTEKQVWRGIARLRHWPSRRTAFIQSYVPEENQFTLRPCRDKRRKRFVRVHRWLWESKLPDDLKDLVLFVRTCFERRDDEGRELFSMNLYGETQRSVRRCCYVGGTNVGRWKSRAERLRKVVRLAALTGLVVEKTGSTSNRAMVVTLGDETPSKTVSEAILKSNRNGQPPRTGTGRASDRNGQAAQQERATPHHRNDTSYPVLYSVPNHVEDPSPSEAGREPTAEQGRGTAATEREAFHQLLSQKNRRIVEQAEQKVLLGDTLAQPRKVAPILEEILDAFDGVTAEDVALALDSASLRGLRSPSWGLVLSDPRITDRFIAALRETCNARQRQKEQDEERVAARIADPDPAVRKQGYEFLMLQGKYDPPAAMERLLAAFRTDPDPQIVTAVAHWLHQYGGPDIRAAAAAHVLAAYA